jgi:cytochrome subunit of sulfide dehydrogenase
MLRALSSLFVIIGLALPAATSAGDDAARNLAAACTSCHSTGDGVDGVKSLAGTRREVMVQAMREFRSGSRSATVMQQIAAAYSDSQVDLIAAWFAAEPSPAPPAGNARP